MAASGIAPEDASVTWKCTATVQYRASDLTPGIEYTPSVGMALAGDSYEWWQNPVCLSIQTPAGQQSKPVNYLDISLKSINDFSFPSFKLTKPPGSNDMVTLTVQTEQKANLTSILLYSNTVKMAQGKYTSPLTISWSFEFTTKYDATSLTPGSLYQFVFALMLKGVSNEGWKDLVNMEVEQPDGTKNASMVNPNDIPLNNYKNFNSRVFAVTQAKGKITLKVTSNQGTNLKSALTVGDIQLVPY